MLTWFLRNRLAAFEKKYGYDTSYVRELVAIDRKAFFAFARAAALGNYRRDVPRDVRWGAGLASLVHEDCGPCTQLLVSMALEDGVAPGLLQALLLGDLAAVPEPVALGVRYARAVLAHDEAADVWREEIERRWGKRAVVALAFTIANAKLYPSVKYALGYGKACQRVTVAGTPVTVARQARPAEVGEVAPAKRPAAGQDAPAGPGAIAGQDAAAGAAKLAGPGAGQAGPGAQA